MTPQQPQAGIREDLQDILASTALAHAATLGPGGEPQSTPVWFIWDGQHLKFSLTTTRQKYRNLPRDPRVAVSLVDPQNPYRSMEIRGVARLAEDVDFSFTDALAQKYMGVEKFPYHQPGDKRITVVVEPQHSAYYGS